MFIGVGSKKIFSNDQPEKNSKKVWTIIGQRNQHTNNRLKELQILKLEEELKLAEIKVIFRWERIRYQLDQKYNI